MLDLITESRTWVSGRVHEAYRFCWMQSGHRSVQDTLVLPFAVAKCERDDIHGWVEARSEHLLLCFAVQALRFDREETRNEWWKKLNRYVSAVPSLSAQGASEGVRVHDRCLDADAGVRSLQLLSELRGCGQSAPAANAQMDSALRSGHVVLPHVVC